MTVFEIFGVFLDLKGSKVEDYLINLLKLVRHKSTVSSPLEVSGFLVCDEFPTACCNYPAVLKRSCSFTHNF